MEIGIIGSGAIGSTLAGHLTAHRHRVLIANSRGPASMEKIAAQTGATPVEVENAAGARDVVIIAVPESAVPKLPKAVLAASSAVIIDTGNYYPARDGRIEEIENGLTESEWVARVIGRKVVKAFNNIQAQSLAARGVPAGATGRIALSMAGDDAREKRVALELIEELGFDGIDAGGLSESWRQQPGSPAYCKDLNADALRSALAKPKVNQIAEHRAEANEAARPFFQAIKRTDRAE